MLVETLGFDILNCLRVVRCHSFQINTFIYNLMCGTEEQVMDESSYAKIVFMDSIK